MYGEILGVSTGATGAVTLAVLPATGGFRPILLVFGVLSVLLGAIIVVVSTIGLLRNHRAKSHV